jgi:hypothetical protein
LHAQASRVDSHPHAKLLALNSWIVAIVMLFYQQEILIWFDFFQA